MAGKDRIRTIEGNGESKLEQKLLTPASRDSGIKTVVIVAVVNVLFSIILDFCVCVKRVTLCNCLCSSSCSCSSSCFSSSVIRNIEEFGARNYFTDLRIANTIHDFRNSIPVLKTYDCDQDTQKFGNFPFIPKR